MTPQPSNAWIAGMEACSNDAGIIDAGAYNALRSEHNARCSVARREVRKARERLNAAHCGAQRELASLVFKSKLEKLIDLEYGNRR